MFISLKQLSLSLCLLGLTTPSWAIVEKVTQQHGIEEYKLENGLRILLVPNEKETKVMLDVVYFTGSLNDPQGKSGLAHLLEHLAFKGTQNIQGDEFQRRLDKYTLRANAMTNHHATRYINVVRPDPEAISQVLLLEAERMQNLVLKTEFVAPEIEIVKREREVRMDKASALMVDRLLKNLYGDQLLGRMPIGSLEEIQKIQLPEIEKYYQTWYAPNNAVLVLTGKFNKNEVLKQIDQTFSPLAAKVIPQVLTAQNINLSQLKERSFTVEKGRDYSTQLIYVANKDQKLRQALTFVPYLYTAQPTGQLYRNMVMSGDANNVTASTWLTKDFNIVYMGAGYTDKSDLKKTTSVLMQQSEANAQFNQAQLQRAKNQMKNAHEQMLADSSAMSSMLAGVLIQENGHWQEYFNQYHALQKIQINEVNQQLSSFFNANKRLVTYTQPTPYTQQNAVQTPTAAQSQLNVKMSEQPIWDKKQFARSAQELNQLQQHSQTQLMRLNQQIQRGQLTNGMTYAIFPTATPDQQTYATLTINFGNEQSLSNQAAALEMMTSLLLKGTSTQTYESIVDQSIELQGQVKSSIENNQLKIELQAPKEKFEAYLSLILTLVKQANFDQSEFDLLKKQRLSYLQRNFTEPKLVSEIQMGRLIEQFSPEDLRYHLEPKQLYAQYQLVKQKNLRQLHQQFIAMNHAQLAVTGEVNPTAIQAILQKNLEDWTSQQNFKRIGEQYQQKSAQHLHVQSEPREFGSYQGYLNFPVGAEHKDAAAMTVFAQVLGNSQLSSRLAMELREKTALVYSFNSRLSLDAFNQAGNLKISADYSTDKSEQISVAVRKTFSDLVNKGLTTQEVEIAKVEIMKQRAAATDDVTRVHRLINSQLERNLDMQSRIIRDQEIASLTVEDVNRVIRRYIDPQQLIEVRADQFGLLANHQNFKTE